MLAAIYAVVFGVLPLAGQADLATLRVEVVDESGAYVPNANVTLLAVRTNATIAQSTTGNGLVTFTALQPGTYEATVEAAGFAETRVAGISLSVNQRRLVPVVLRISSVQEVVEITATTSLQTEDSTVGAVFENVSLRELPIQQMRYTDLIRLVNGAEISASDGLQQRGYGWVAINGNYATQNNFLLDGFDNNQGTTNIQARSAQVAQPSPYALDEFKVQTSAYSAEFGRGAGAVVNVSLKSGTNEFHGSGWYFNRNDALAANAWSNNLIGAPKPNLTWNQFGATFGGPIVRDRLFFFSDYEGFGSNIGSTERYTVPTTDMKQGVFPFLIVDPQTGEPFPNNVLPSSRFDPMGKKVGDLYPNPNGPGTTDSAGRNSLNYERDLTDEEDTHKFDVRIDFYATDNHRIYGRYSFIEQDMFLSPIFDGIADGEGTRGTQYNRSQSVGLSWGWTVSPNAINELRFGYTRQYGRFAHNTINEMTATEFGFLGIPPEMAEIGGLPKIDMTTYQKLGTRNFRPQDQLPQQFQFLNTYSHVSGPHLVKLGVEYRYKNNRFVDVSRRVPDFRFRGRNTQDAFADLLLGMADRLRMNTVPISHQRQDYYALFIQDDIKATSRLTFNLGFRYEYTTPFYAKAPVYNKNFDYNLGQLIVAPELDPAGLGVAGPDKYLVDRDLNNFGPRLGVAYQVVPQSVVLRAGYGIFYGGEDFIGASGNLPMNPPSLLERAVDRQFILSEPIPSGLLSPDVLDTTTLNLRSRPREAPLPMVQQFNVALEFLLPGQSTFQVAYVGNRGRNLYSLDSGNMTPFGINGNVAANRPFPQWRQIEIVTPSTRSWYNALQVDFRRRFANGFLINAQYAYASALNEGGSFTSSFVTPQIPGDFQRALNPEFARNRFTASAVWEIPVGRNRALGSGMNKALDAVIGGWQLSGTATLLGKKPQFWFMNQTGFTPDNQFYSFTDRNAGYFLFPNCVGDPMLGASTKNRENYLNLDAFAFQGVDKPGNCSYGALRAPETFVMDLSLAKNFSFVEGQQLQVRLDAFNALNHTNYGAPFPLYGTPGLFGQILGAKPPRDVQIGLRYVF